MTAFSKRLMDRLPYLDNMKAISDDYYWTFSDYLSDLSTTDYLSLIKSHMTLTIEYNVFCAQLAANFMRSNATADELTEQIIAALMMAELLAFIYHHYLAVPREVERLRRDQRFYRQLLLTQGLKFSEDLTTIEAVTPDTFTQKIRLNTGHLNWLRLFTARIKRLMDSFVPVIKQFESYPNTVKKINVIATPFFSYLSWLFFLPRLTSNTSLTTKHLVPCSWWMGEKERELNWLFRLTINLERRWAEYGNDIPWVIAGLLNCFVLTGPLMPIGVYLTVSLFAYDILVAALRAYIELSRLKEIRQSYAAMTRLPENQYEQYEQDDLRQYQQHLDAYIRYEQKRMALSVFNVSALFLAMALTIPLLAFTPYMALVAAVLLVTLTIVVYFSFKLLERSKPKNSVTDLAQRNAPGLRFFQSTRIEKPLGDIELRPVDSGNGDLESRPGLVYSAA